MLLNSLLFLSLSNFSFGDLGNKVTTCLARVYAHQSIHKKKNDEYTSDLRKLINHKFCSGVNLSVLSATSDSFLITGESENSMWSIDSEKQIKQVK